MRRVPPLIAGLTGAVAGAALTLSLSAPGRTPDAPRPRAPILGEARVSTLLAWTPGRLPQGYARQARRLEGVRAAAVVRSGIAWLSGWRDREGRLVSPPRGLRWPVEVAAIDPSGYLPFVPPAERAAFAELASGGALLGRTASALRGAGPGATLSFGRRDLRVLAVVDDELIGAHEVVVSRRTGGGLGIVLPRYLLVAPGRGGRPEVVEAGLRRLVPPGTRLRLRAPGETPVFRHGDAVLPPIRLKEIFGEFAAVPLPGGTLRADPRWIRENIRTARVPILGSVRCHRRALPQIRAALEELARRGLGRLLDPADYGGCFSPRYANLDRRAALSHHSWGVALDVNVSENPLGAEPRLDRRVVDAFERWGFTWGDRWLVPDPMHFEFLSFPRAIKG